MVPALAIRRLSAVAALAALGARGRPAAQRHATGADRARSGLSGAPRRHASPCPLVLWNPRPAEHPPGTARHGILASGLTPAHRPVQYRNRADRLCTTVCGCEDPTT